MPGTRIAEMRNHAREIFLAGIEAVRADNAVRRHVSLRDGQLIVDGACYRLSDFRHIYVIGAGKASASMAQAMEQLLGDRITRGIVNVKYGHVAPVTRVRLVEAGHPVPDEAGRAGAEAILELASQATAEDLVICVISGGGSALLPLPVEGVGLEDKREATRALLSCGATIHEINAVRKHISLVKGGGLARTVAPAALLALMLSDVVGDDLDVIASGPTVADPTSFESCMEILRRYGIQDKMPRSVVAHLKKGVAGEVIDNPKPGDSIFERTRNVIVGNNMECVSAAEETARRLGYDTLVLSTMLEGEAKEVARVHGAVAKEILKSGHPLAPPACVLSGGEPTVTIKGQGLGGRNQEFALAVAPILAGWRPVVFLSGGTDGTDGPTDAAGAVVDGETAARGGAMGMPPARYLADNDAYHFFEKLGDLVKTGPTDTNVMDLHVLLVG